MAWDRDRAVHHATTHAKPSSVGKCARYVREAIGAGGIILARTQRAKDYGTMLIAAGFVPTQGTPAAGDVVVIQPAPGHPDGHMAIFDGVHWIADFKQLHGLYPGPAYRSAHPSYIVYRHR